MIKTRERWFWVVLVCLLASGVVWANWAGPFIVTNSSGSPLHVLDTNGYIQNTGAKQMTSSSNWLVANSDGTAEAGFTPTGVLLSLNDADSCGSLALDGTGEVTQTFGVAEADTNYEIVGALYSTTVSVTDAVCVKNKTTAAFSVTNGPQYPSTVAFKWVKIRTAQ